MIPLLAWFLVSAGKRGGLPRWQGALLLVWLLTTLLIAVKGYYNTRYQLTLFPLTTAMVLYLLWQLLEGKKQYLKILCFSFLGLMCLYNIYHYADRYTFFWDLRVSLKTPHFPYKLVDYLNANKNINDKSKVLTLDQPLFYYHTDKKGYDYINPYAADILVEFKKKAGSRQKIYRILKRWYDVDYILLSANHKRLYRFTMLEEFLHCECHLVVKDKNRLLYRLRDKLLEEQIKSPLYKQIKVWNDKETTVEKISPPLLRFYKSGMFKFAVSKGSKGKIITIRNSGVKKGKTRRIHLGYEFNRRGLDMSLDQLAGRYVNVIVRAAISPNLLGAANRGKNFISVSDYQNKTWSSQKAYFMSHHWRTYLVSKKIRPGITRLLLMFRFIPQSPKDRLRIKNVKIVISETPLREGSR